MTQTDCGDMVPATALSWAIFYAALLTLVVIDLRDYLLPDAMTQPLIWIGLLAVGAGLHRVISTPVNDALQGAVAGYVGLWAIAAVYTLATGTEGMDKGDFKLLAMPGAWAVVAMRSSLLASPTKNKK